MDDLSEDPVVVVGGGISGVACARALHDAGVPVGLLDRGMRLGGRMASRRLHERPVDLGASYFTVSDDAFRAVVDDWQAAGLARPWTDTFEVRSPDAPPETKQGPVRWGAPGALRSLVEALAEPLVTEDRVRRAAVTAVRRREGGSLVVATATEELRAAAVVLAMPDAQAHALLGPGLEPITALLHREWEPALALMARFAERRWDLDGAFVHDDPDLSWVADDGARRGDGAPVLVAHSTPERAARHLEDPDAAAPALTEALVRVLDLPEPPTETLVKRWSLSQPAGERDAPYLLDDTTGALLGACGDGWGTPKVEGAWLSGHRLGLELARRLAD